MLKAILVILFISGLWYMAIPTDKDNQSSQIANLYTNDTRSQITDYYSNNFQKYHCNYFKLINYFCYIRPLRINHSPSLATTFISAAQKSTYLEEYYYPLRSSILISGYEPKEEDKGENEIEAEKLVFNNTEFKAIVTLKYTDSSIQTRIFIYLLIWLIIYAQFMVFKILRRKKREK
jgi:hypothetical protein